MTEPTNHRAEAEDWLEVAADRYTDRAQDSTVIAGALISISHWLGAIHEALLAGPPTVTVVKAEGVLTRQQFRDLLAGQPQPKEPT